MTAGMFDAMALDAIVQRTLLDNPTIPEGAHGAFVMVANANGIKAIIALKIAETWTVDAVVEREWRDDAPIKFGVTVTGSF